MKHSDSGTEILAQKLNQAKLKITPQRMAILSELADNYEHPTADAVYQQIKKKLPNISFDTVNRTLIIFVKKGVIKRAEGHAGAKRYDPMTDTHHHFHCIVCNKIIDFMDKKYDKIKLPASITKQHQVLDQKIVLNGICGNCKNKRGNQGRNNN